MTYFLFLTDEELHELTGFTRKARQIAQLRKMGIPFHINGCGKPKVTRSAIEGGIMRQPAQQRLAWQSAMQQPERKAA
ncbi:MAG: DUF4224 domain-containing protein [Gallionellaceae bacterium]